MYNIFLLIVLSNIFYKYYIDPSEIGFGFLKKCFIFEYIVDGKNV